MQQPRNFANRLLNSRAFLFILIVLAALRVPAEAEPNWPVLSRVPVLTNFSQTTDIQNAGDSSGRLFLVRKSGTIHILKNGALLGTPFLDISLRTIATGERGLLGLAFPPNFSATQYFYVFYTRSPDGAIVLSRFSVGTDPDVAAADSEEVLFVVAKPASDHNGGQIAFGPDALLYVAIGDGGGHADPQRNGQKLTTLLGKLLRIDVSNVPAGQTYTIPASNPFAGSAVNRPEILCWGLRNPWRFSFDSLTGDLYLSDVGESQREEINVIPAGSLNSGTNLGWSVMEGTLDFAAQGGVTGNLQSPTFEYDHSLGFAVTGGYLYRGSNPRLHGLYLFSDFGSGRIWAMRSPTNGGQTAVLMDTDHSVSTFGRDEMGELYYADFYLGTIYRLDAPETLPPPTIYPAAGTYTHSTPCYIYTDVPGAVLRYTTDGTDPNESSPVFTPGSPINIVNPTTVRAAMYRSDLRPSPVAQAAYQLRPHLVQFDAPSQYLYEYTYLRLTNLTPDTEIRYTLDGSDPSQESALYSDQNPILLTRQTTVSAVAFKQGWAPGEVSRTTFFLEVVPAAFVTPLCDLYEPVALQSLTPEAIIHYTTDGSGPTLQSPVWTGAQYLPAGVTIKTLSERGQMGMNSSILKVIRISRQKATFDKIGNAPSLAADVVRMDESTVYTVGGYELWKISNGTSTRLLQGGFAQNFQAAVLTSDLKIAVADSGTQDVIQFLPPTYTTHIRWESNPVAAMDLVSEPGGGFLLAGGSSHRIHRITASDAVATVAGTGVAGSQDGPAAQATFNLPIGIARGVDGRVFVAEGSGRRVRRIDLDNQVTTLAGTGEQGLLDGPGTTARFERPRAMVRDRIGNLYVSDYESAYGQIRKIQTDGTVTTLCGPVLHAGTVRYPENVGLIEPRGLDIDQNGALYFTDRPNSSIYRVVQEDWDNDGVPDAMETIVGPPFSVGVDDRFEDADGDKFSNVAEWIAKTDSQDPGERPRNSQIARQDQDTLSLCFTCEVGATYQLEYSDDLDIWKPMGAPFVATLRSHTAQARLSPVIPRRVFRLRQQ